MAASKLRKVARAARWAAAFVAAAVLLGVGTPVLRHAVDAAAQQPSAGLSPAGLAALVSTAAVLDPAAPDVHPSVPRGYSVPGPVAAPAANSATAATTSPGAPAPAPARTPATGRAPAAAPAPAVVAGSALPLPVDVGSSTQVITVVAPSPGSTTATLTAWQLGPGGWTVAVGPVRASIGSAGVGAASEDTTRTPEGTFTLTEAFGRLGNPGTGLSYRVINPSDYWVSDRTSPLYNQFQECASACPFKTAAGEHLWDAGSSYNYAVVIDYNRRPAVPGAGSAFFLHVTNGIPTAGCVAIPQNSLVAIMAWLSPAARPLISIGVG